VRTALLALVPVALVAVAASAAPLPPIVHGRPRPWQPPVTARAGMRVALDPATGELITPPANDPGLTGIVRPIDRGAFTIRTRPDGSSYVVLDGRIRDYVIVGRAASGAWREECVQTRVAPVATASDCAGTEVGR
jgi:hypothetical protein